MGRLELVVLGLTCCSAVVSGAKVSDSPAQRQGTPSPPAQPDPDTVGDRQRGGEADRRVAGRKSQRRSQPRFPGPDAAHRAFSSAR